MTRLTESEQELAVHALVQFSILIHSWLSQSKRDYDTSRQELHRVGVDVAVRSREADHDSR